MTIEYAEVLQSQKKSLLATQLLKSGTPIEGNELEARNAASKPYFNLNIAAKEAEEFQYWLWLCEKSKGIQAAQNYSPELKHS